MASPTATILCLDGDPAVLRAIPPVVDGRALTIQSPALLESAAGDGATNGAGSPGGLDVAAVVALARRVSPAAILLPLENAEGAGLDSLLALRAALPDVPVIALSGFTGVEYETRAREAGSHLVLQKPCLPDELARAVVEAARSRKDPS